MKFNFQYIFLLFFFFFFTPNLNAQQKQKKVETAEVQVTGVCKMCKSRIENAALIKGVKHAEWDKHTQLLKVVYKPSKTSLKDIQASVAKAGHDTKEIKATEKNYKRLPNCCAYKDGAKVH